MSSRKQLVLSRNADPKTLNSEQRRYIREDLGFVNKTSAEWTSENPVLGEGEQGYDKDRKAFKIGDGVTAWNDLPYIVNGESVNVKWFGAKGDGTTDDTAAINAALGVGYHVVFESGSYKITDELQPQSNQILSGSGDTEIFYEPVGDYSSAIDLNDNTDVIIEKIVFRGTGLEKRGTSSYTGLAIGNKDNEYAQRITVRDCVFKDFVCDTRSGVGCIGMQGTDLFIRDNFFAPSNVFFNNMSFMKRVGNVTITGNHSRSYGGAFINIARFENNGLLIPDTEVSIASHHIIQGNIYHNCNFNNNIITDHGSGILVHYKSGLSHTIISGNIVTNCFRHGIYLKSDAEDSLNAEEESGPDIITNNIIRYCGGGNFQGESGRNNSIHAEGTRGTIVSNNIIEHSGYNPDGSARTYTAAGIGFERANRNCTISDNVIDYTTGSAINFQISEGGVGTTGPSAEMDHNAENLLIQGNIVDHVKGKGILLKGGDEAVERIGQIMIQNNSFRLRETNQLGIAISVNEPFICSGNLIVGSDTATGQSAVVIDISSNTPIEGQTCFLSLNHIQEIQYGLSLGAAGDSAYSFVYGDFTMPTRLLGDTIRVKDNIFHNVGSVARITSDANSVAYISPSNTLSGTTPSLDTDYATGSQVCTAEIIGVDSSKNVLARYYIDVTSSYTGFTPGEEAYDESTNTVYYFSAVWKKITIEYANTLCVSKNGTDNRTGLDVHDFSNPFLTVTAAQSAAASGDTILVLPGDYSGETALAGKDGVTYQGLDGAILPAFDVTTAITVKGSGLCQSMTCSNAGAVMDMPGMDAVDFISCNTGTQTAGNAGSYIECLGGTSTIRLTDQSHDGTTRTPVYLSGDGNLNFYGDTSESTESGGTVVDIANNWSGSLYMAGIKLVATTVATDEATTGITYGTSVTGTVNLKDCTIITAEDGTGVAKAIDAPSAQTVYVQGSLNVTHAVDSDITLAGGSAIVNANFM